MIWTRREWLFGAGAAIAGCAPRREARGCASLEGTTIRWIVPFADGGSHEVYSRLIEPLLERRLGAEIIVVTEPGNGGIVGATKLRDASPDGRTLGILNAPGLFGAALAGEPGYPNPARDFTVLGRVARSRPAVAVAASSDIRTIADLIARSNERPLLCGFTGIGSNNLMVMSGCERLLGLRLDYIAGLSGSRENVLAVLRGDTDVMSSNFESLLPFAEQGDLRIVLQISEGPILDAPELRDVAWLGGGDGVAARRAGALNRDTAGAIADAAGLIEVSGAGIIVCAPKTLPSELTACLGAHLHDVLSSADLRSASAATGRSLEVGTGQDTLAELLRAGQAVERIAPVVRNAFARARK